MSYNGGKAQPGVYHTIINQIPPHRVYVEPFLGMGAVLRYKRPAAVSIGIDADPTVLERWSSDDVPNLHLSCADALTWLRAYRWRGDEFVYCDPPYLRHVRTYQRRLYGVEFWDIDSHRALLELLRTLPCYVAISGYDSALYALHLHDWRAITYTAVARSGEPRTEWLWMNYPEPAELHDYRYLGSGWRDRERIKRKKLRWRARFAALPQLERMALYQAVDEVRAGIAGTGDADGATS
jgi:DNA adenine methylase